nr:hypothetical protein [Tanacetum cinerariifolium]
MRDFYKTHPSGSGTITKTAPNAAKIKPSVTNKGTSVKLGVLDVTKEESTENCDQENDSDDDKTQSDNENESDSEHEIDESESDSESDYEENEEDEEEVKDGFVKTPSNNSDDENETMITNKAEGDEDEEMDYTTSQLYEDVDIRLMNQLILIKVTTLEKEVAEVKKDPLHTQVTALVDDHLDARLEATRDEFMNFLSASLRGKSSQPQSLYEAAAMLTEFELKNILIDKMDKSESYLAAPEREEFYEGLKKSYDLNKNILSTYGKVYSLKRSRKDKDEDPSTGSDRGLKKRKTSKDATPTTGPKAKESQSGSSKGDKSQSKSSGKFVQLEEPEFEVSDLDMPQDQEDNPGNGDEEPKEKTLQQGQNQSWLMTLASSSKKPSKTFDELMSSLIDFSAFIMNDLKINNLTQETLLGPAFRLLKGTRSNYAELEYDFEECYKALLEKLDWENPKGGDYPFDLTKPLPLVMSGNRQKVPVDYFFNNDLKYLQGGVSTMTYTTSITKTKNRLTNLSGDDISDFAIALMFTRSLVIQKRVEDLQLRVESYQKKINVTKPETTKFGIRKRDPYTPHQEPKGFIYFDTNGRNRLI